MPTIDFGPRTLATLKDPASGPNGAVVWDELFDRSTPGLYLRASSTGARTWMFMGRVLRNGSRKLAKFKIGSAWAKDNQSGLQLSAARTAAAALKGDLKAGIDPAQRDRDEERARAETSANTFEAAVTTFLAQYPKSKRLRPATERQYRDFLQGDDFAILNSKPLASITKADITKVLDKMQSERGVTVRANRGLASARKMFRWYVGRGTLVVDPTAGMTPPVAETPRKRHLFGGRNQPSEIALAWRAFQRCGGFAPFLKLLMLTGQRRDEVAGMSDAELFELDGEAPYWVIPAERTKNHREHHVPLGPMAVQIVRTLPRVDKCPYLFTTNGLRPISGFSKLKRQVDRAAAEIKAADSVRYAGQLEEPWTFHDLRRTLKTGLATLRVDKEVRDALLNHARQGVDAHYDHSELNAEKRAAVEAWEQHIAACLQPHPAT